MNIYLVAVIHQGNKRKRTWGWYEKFEDAERAVIENHTDIFERGYYDLAVIEEMPEGVAAVEVEAFWYRAKYAQGKDDPVVTKIKRPSGFALNCCLTLGGEG